MIELSSKWRLEADRAPEEKIELWYILVCQEKHMEVEKEIVVSVNSVGMEPLVLLIDWLIDYLFETKCPYAVQTELEPIV